MAIIVRSPAVGGIRAVVLVLTIAINILIAPAQVIIAEAREVHASIKLARADPVPEVIPWQSLVEGEGGAVPATAITIRVHVALAWMTSLQPSKP